MGFRLRGMVPGAAANNDTPFLYLDRPLGMACGTLPWRPFALDWFCVNRPKVDVFDVRSGCMVKLGIISAPRCWSCGSLRPG